MLLLSLFAWNVGLRQYYFAWPFSVLFSTRQTLFVHSGKPLDKIAKALGVPVTALIEDVPEEGKKT